MAGKSNSYAAEDISSSGKPARNYKTFVVVILGLGAATGMLYNNLFPAKEDVKQAKEISKTEVDLAKVMEADARNAAKLPPPLSAPTAPEPKAPDTSGEDARRMTILGSPMEVAGINITDNRKGSAAAAAASQLDQLRKGTQSMEERLMANAEKALAGQGGGASALKMASTGRNAADSDFLFANSTDSFEEPLNMHQAHSGHALYQGHVIRAVLVTAVNSDLPGNFIANVTNDVYDSVTGKILLVPKGTRIFGQYSSEVAIGQSRLLVASNRFIFPNGQSFSAQKSSTADLQGNVGLNAKVNNHFFEMFGTALIVGAAAWLMPQSDRQTSTVTNGDGGSTSSGSIMGQALAGTTKTIMDRNKSMTPTLTAKQGDPFLIMIGRDVMLPEYVR